jgi:hypothetical protein
MPPTGSKLHHRMGLILLAKQVTKVMVVATLAMVQDARQGFRGDSFSASTLHPQQSFMRHIPLSPIEYH